MADTQAGPTDLGFVDKRRGRDFQGQTIAEAANMGSVSALRARLTAINSTTFTAARLNAMTVNDMVYALRMHSADVAGVK